MASALSGLPLLSVMAVAGPQQGEGDFLLLCEQRELLSAGQGGGSGAVSKYCSKFSRRALKLIFNQIITFCLLH